MAYENQTYTLEGIKTALRVIDEKRDTLLRINGDTNISVSRIRYDTHIVVSLQELHDLLNDIESAIYGDLEYEDEE